MLIRRQDKKAIFNIDTCRVLYVAETVGGCFKICADQFEQLGTYKTEERAMELWLISLHILRYSVWESIASPTNSAS